MRKSELHIFSFDTFFRFSPVEQERPLSWWASACSVEDIQPPGFDPSWDFAVLRVARRSLSATNVRTALLTTRPAHNEMTEAIKKILHEASLDFDFVCLKPVWPPMDTPDYKVNQVRRWVVQERTVKSVLFCDRNVANQRAVTEAARQMQLPCEVPMECCSTVVAATSSQVSPSPS